MKVLGFREVTIEVCLLVEETEDFVEGNDVVGEIEVESEFVAWLLSWMDTEKVLVESTDVEISVEDTEKVLVETTDVEMSVEDTEKVLVESAEVEISVEDTEKVLAETTDVEMSVEDGLIELSMVWEVKIELGKLTFEVDFSMDENVEDSVRVWVLEVKTDEL